MTGPYNLDPRVPIYQVSAVLVFDEQAEAEALALQLAGEYRGEVVVNRRLGERPNLQLMRLTTLGNLP